MVWEIKIAIDFQCAVNCNISCALGYIARNYGILKQHGYLRLVYDDKIYIIAKQKYNTPKKCTTATHPRCAQCTYILQIVIQKNASTIHPRCVGAVVGEYCVEAVTSGYLPIARPAPFSFFISLVLFVCLFCFGISLVTMRGVRPSRSWFACFFFSFFGILSMTSGYLPITSLRPFS